MIYEKESEVKVKRYADSNNYTILANTFGALEYVKYDYSKYRVTKFLKWSKKSRIDCGPLNIITQDDKVLRIDSAPKSFGTDRKH